MGRDDVAVVVVSYNAVSFLRRCLDAIVRPGREVVVVDNASTDGSVALARERNPGVALVALEENRGFGAAANTGIRATRAAYVLLLNCDAWPVDDDAVRALVERAERAPAAALLGPQLVGLDGLPHRSVIRQPGHLGLVLSTVLPGGGSRAYGVLRRLGRSDEEVGEREFVQGAAVLLRRSAFEQVGGFDERFFMYNEEVDLCLRLRRAGWRIELVPSARFVHVGGASTRTEADRMYREYLRSHIQFRAKHEGELDAQVTRRLLVSSLRLRSVFVGGGRERATADWLSVTDTRFVGDR